MYNCYLVGKRLPAFLTNCGDSKRALFNEEIFGSLLSVDLKCT